MKIVAIVPAKSTSERIEGKNNSLLSGVPLYVYAIYNLLKCDFIDEIWLDTDSLNMYKRVKHLGVKLLHRDKDLANNKTDGHVLFMNEVKNIDADIYVQVLCTSPFIKSSTIQNGIHKVALKEYDSAILMSYSKDYIWDMNGPTYGNKIPNSNDLQFTIKESMGLYIVSKETALKNNKRYGNSPYFIKADQIECVDINNKDDLELANKIANGIKIKETTYLNSLKTKLTSAILHDAIGNLNKKLYLIKGLTPNINNTKLFGRCKTLKIRTLEPNEDFKGIYDSMNVYETICNGDILLVENGCDELAFFGQINSHLAIRSGCQGAVISGYTRDINDTIQNNFPVFYGNSTCTDVKFNGTTESINEPISMNKTQVYPDDLIFCDREGCIRIPRNDEESVIEECLKIIKKESDIINSILKEESNSNINERYGNF